MSAQDEGRSGAEVLLNHIEQHHPEVVGLVAAQSGSLNDEVADMLAKGWTVERVEYVAGKRLRIMRPPAIEPRCVSCGGGLVQQGEAWVHANAPGCDALIVPEGLA